jgi:putative membrane protein
MRMDEKVFDGGGAMHGPAGGWELVEMIGTFWALLVLLVLLALLVWGTYRFTLRPRVGGRVDPAEGILRERLARGEVSTDEYESTLDILRSSQAQSTALEPRNGASLIRTYEDYVREAMNRLRLGRNAGS